MIAIVDPFQRDGIWQSEVGDEPLVAKWIAFALQNERWQDDVSQMRGSQFFRLSRRVKRVAETDKPRDPRDDRRIGCNMTCNASAKGLSTNDQALTVHCFGTEARQHVGKLFNQAIDWRRWSAASFGAHTTHVREFDVCYSGAQANERFREGDEEGRCKACASTMGQHEADWRVFRPAVECSCHVILLSHVAEGDRAR